MVAQFFQPPCHIVISLMLADIINEESADSTTVVGRGNSPVAFLTSSIPNLCLDSFGINLDGSGCKLHSYSGLAIEVEFVSGESAQKVGFSDT